MSGVPVHNSRYKSTCVIRVFVHDIASSLTTPFHTTTLILVQYLGEQKRTKYRINGTATPFHITTTGTVQYSLEY